MNLQALRKTRWVSVMVLLNLCGLLLVQPKAWAAADSGVGEAPRKLVLPAEFEEVPPAEANQISPLSPDLLQRYQQDAHSIGLGNLSQVRPFGLLTITAGVVLLDVLVNLGKAVWTLVESGRPQIHTDLDVASAVPKGIQDWSQLEGWQDPVSKLYRAKLLVSENKSLGDIYFRLLFAYGGSYQGKGRYLKGVTIMPAQLFVPYLSTFNAKSQVLEISNQGTKDDPIAGMTMHLQWGLSSMDAITEQSIDIHVRGDGKVTALPSAEDVPVDVSTTNKVTPCRHIFPGGTSYCPATPAS